MSIVFSLPIKTGFLHDGLYLFARLILHHVPACYLTNVTTDAFRAWYSFLNVQASSTAFFAVFSFTPVVRGTTIGYCLRIWTPGTPG